tara:strand:+ start:270 stop:479 length:210 start_codon:yes stop_codon:yes gene_type:complete
VGLSFFFQLDAFGFDPYLIGFILPLGLVFFRPSATTVSPFLRPAVTSTIPCFLKPISISVFFTVFSFYT